MSSTGVKIGYGSALRIGRGETPVWTDVVGLEEITFPTNEKDEIEATHMQSPDSTKEYIPGLNDNGTTDFSVQWVPGSDLDVLLSEIHASGETVILEYTAANGGTAETYAAFCKAYSRTAPLNAKMMATATFRVNGKVTLV